MSNTTFLEAEFEAALVDSLTIAGAVAIREFRVPGTSFMLDIYVASPARAFIEIAPRNPLSPLDTKRFIKHTSEAYHLFSGEVAPIVIVGDQAWQRMPNDALKDAGILVVSVDDSCEVSAAADRCAKSIWDFLTNLPYEFKGRSDSGIDVAAHLPSATVEVAEKQLELHVNRSAGERDYLREERHFPFDIFSDVLISLQSILTFEQFEVLSHELAAFSEEYHHEHYTACGLRVGRTLEHVVYALARAWGVNVNRATLQVLSDLDNAFEQLSRTVVEYAGSEENEKSELRGRLQDRCQLVSNKLLRLVFDIDAMELEKSDVPINVESIVRDIKKRFAARQKVRRAIDPVFQTDLIRQILDIRNTAAHAHTTGARRELSQNEVDEAVELLRTALFIFSNVAFAVAERDEC